MNSSIVAPELVWGLIPRFVGLLYILAFGGLAPQINTMIGSRGIGPIAPRLMQARRDFPGLRRFAIFPSVLWISHSDCTIRALPWLGVLCGALCIYGGPYAFWAQLTAVVLWRSLEPAALIFPWDTMLLEAGFLTLFLPPVLALPSVSAIARPYPAVAFILQFFVLRLMLGFGKVKFVGTKKEDALYLRGFFAWSSTTKVAWFAHHLPASVLRLMLYFMFVGEIVAPVLGFFPGLPRVISFALLAMLMVGIQVTGNWGFFNIGYLLLSVCLLDSSASLGDLAREPWRSTLFTWPHLALNTLMALLFLLGIVYLIASESWSSRTSVHWALDQYTWKRPILRGFIGFLRAISPLRIVNGYGVFPPSSQPPMLQVPMFEGSDDGATWHAYRYRFIPTSEKEGMRFVAPYHPRIDMAAAYSCTGVYDASFYGSLISDGTPYATYTRSSWLERMCQRLLAGEPEFLAIFSHNPFPDAPPKQIRVCTVALSPTQLDVFRATGAWWHVRRLGITVPAHGKASWPDTIAVPEPEVFHPDWLGYKRASVQLKAIGAAHRAGEAPNDAILHESDLSAAEVRAFWDDFLPEANHARGDFEHHVAHAARLEARFGMLTLARFERILERFAWLLRLRTERHQFAEALPNLPVKSNFRYHMFLLELVMDGEQAYLDYLSSVPRVVERFAQSRDETQLWALTLLRHRQLVQHIAAFRWTTLGVDLHNGKVPGIFEYHPLLARYVPEGEEFRPAIEKLANGEHAIPGLYPTPSLTSTDSPGIATG